MTVKHMKFMGYDKDENGNLIINEKQTNSKQKLPVSATTSKVVVITESYCLLIKNNLKTAKFDDIDKIFQDVGFNRRHTDRGSSYYK